MKNQDSADYLEQAISLLRTGNLVAATEALQQAVQADPSNAQAHFELGNAQATLGNFDKASAAFAAVIALRPNLAAAHFNKANMDRERGEVSAALQGYRAAAKLDPQATYLNNLGTLLADNHQLEA